MKNLIFIMALMASVSMQAEGFHVVTEVAGVELDDNKDFCCFYLDHMIYYNNNYVGCYSSMTGTCCPKETGSLQGNGSLTPAQLTELANSSEFINANAKAIQEFLLEKSGQMGQIEFKINQSNGNLILTFTSNYSTIANLSIRPFTFGNTLEATNINITKGHNELEINYQPAIQSLRPQNYLIKMIGEKEGFKTIARI